MIAILGQDDGGSPWLRYRKGLSSPEVPFMLTGMNWAAIEHFLTSPPPAWLIIVCAFWCGGGRLIDAEIRDILRDIAGSNDALRRRLAATKRELEHNAQLRACGGDPD